MSAAVKPRLTTAATAAPSDRLRAIAAVVERGEVKQARGYLELLERETADLTADERSALRVIGERLDFGEATAPLVSELQTLADFFSVREELRASVAGSIEPYGYSIEPQVRALHNARTLREWLADPKLLKPPREVAAKIGALEGRSLLCAAPEKSGKSTLQAQTCAAISRGIDFLGARTICGRALYCGLEEHPGDIVRRFAALDADLDNITILTELVGVAGLRSILAEGNYVYAVIDSLVELATGVVTDPFSSAQWQPLVQGITHLAHTTNTCIALLHHSTKSTGRYRDSSAIGAGVDVICEMHEPTDAEARRDPTMRLLNVRGRGYPLLKTYVHLSSPGSQLYELARSSEFSVDLQVLQWVEKNPGCSSRDVERGVGKRAQDVRETLRQLDDAGTIEDRGGKKPGRLKGSSWYALARSLAPEFADDE